MLIKNAKIYGEILQDIRIENDIITQISDEILPKSGESVLDAAQKTLLPSFVDLNVCLKNDKFSLDNLDLLESECLRGGVGAIVLRDCAGFDDESFELFTQNLHARVLEIFPSIKCENENNELRNLATLINKGAFCLELKSSLPAHILRASLQYAMMKKVSVFASCYEGGFDDNGVMNDGELAFEMGLVGMSGVAETSEIVRMKELAHFYNANLIIDFPSLKRSLDLAGNLPILASIHHLIKDESACKDFNTAAKIFPPLRTNEDKNAFITALKEKKINFLSAAHSPKSISLKDLAFDAAAFGSHSICDFIALCYTFFIKNEILTWKELCEMTAKNAAKFLGLNAGEIALNKLANLLIFDESFSYEVQQSSLYANEILHGKIAHHIINGELIF